MTRPMSQTTLRIGDIDIDSWSKSETSSCRWAIYHRHRKGLGFEYGLPDKENVNTLKIMRFSSRSEAIQYCLDKGYFSKAEALKAMVMK